VEAEAVYDTWILLEGSVSRIRYVLDIDTRWIRPGYVSRRVLNSDTYQLGYTYRQGWAALDTDEHRRPGPLLPRDLAHSTARRSLYPVPVEALTHYTDAPPRALPHARRHVQGSETDVHHSLQLQVRPVAYAYRLLYMATRSGQVTK
jgi:hypothetical protein